MRRLLPIIALLALTACGVTAGLRRTLGAGTLPDRYSIAAGTAGTVTVGTGKYVLGCTAAATATNATVTVTPCGPSIPTCTAQTAMAVPSTATLTFVPPGAPNAIADTSTIVFANTSNFACGEWQYSP